MNLPSYSSYSQKLLTKYHGIPVFSPLCNNNINKEQEQEQKIVQSTYDKTSKHCSLVIPQVYGKYNENFDDTLYGKSYHEITTNKKYY